MKVHEFDRLETKLKLKVRNASDRLAWFEHEGRIVTRTRRSHGNKDLPSNLIRQQLKLDEKQFAGMLSCSLSLKDYIEILKGKGLIPPTPRAA
jgi:hypothetical protein